MENAAHRDDIHVGQTPSLRIQWVRVSCRVHKARG